MKELRVLSNQESHVKRGYISSARKWKELWSFIFIDTDFVFDNELKNQDEPYMNDAL